MVQQAVEHEAQQDPESRAGIQQHEIEVESARKRPRSTAAASSVSEALESRGEEPREAPGASGSGSGQRVRSIEEGRSETLHTCVRLEKKRQRTMIARAEIRKREAELSMQGWPNTPSRTRGMASR